MGSLVNEAATHIRRHLLLSEPVISRMRRSCFAGIIRTLCIRALYRFQTPSVLKAWNLGYLRGGDTAVHPKYSRDRSMRLRS